MSGLSSSGFDRQRLEDIKTALEELFGEAFGTINLDPNGVFGLMIGIESQPLTTAWEELENVYYSAYPASAEGFNLDQVCALSGIVRLAAESSSVQVAVWGAVGTGVPAGFQGSVVDTGEIFSLLAKIDLLTSIAVGAEIEVVAPAVAAVYTLTVNGTGYTFDNQVIGATAATIAASIASDVDSGEADITGTNVAEVMTFIATDGLTIFTVGAVNPAHFTINEVAVTGVFESDNTGEILALVDTLTVIETPTGGVNSITNNVVGTLGRDLETDVALRLRRTESIALVGTCTVDAIRAHILQEVDSVIGCTIIENRTDAPVGGIAAHAFKTIVQGGTNQDIAEKIWDLKPAGIETVGDVPIVVTDSMGNPQTVNFSRPDEVLLWIDVAMTENTEESFPTDGELAVRTAVLNAGDGFDIGDDIIINKLVAAIYGNVAGIATTTITWEVGVGPETPPHGNSGNITIDPDEIGMFDLTRITATMA